MLDTRGAALRSQVPLTALMVVYTFVSLSILAEPIVERRAPAQPSQIGAEIAVPADAVLPEPGSGRLRPVGAGKIARQKLTYRVLGSAFHDGTRTSAADLLYAYMFAYRWGARGEAAMRTSIRWSPPRPRSCARSSWACGSSAPTPPRNRFAIGDFEFVRELFVVEVYTSTPPHRRRSRMRSSLRRGARCPGICWC